MTKITLLLTSLLFAVSALATEIDAKKSTFTWTGKKVTGSHTGTLPVQSSDIKMKNGKVTGGEIVLSVANMTNTDLTGEYQTKFLNHMKSEDFFNVSKWPTAKLVVESVKGNKATGKLTIKDKTNPVTFDFTEKKGVYSGTLKFDRTKYGMIYGSGDFFKNLGDKMIYNDVTLDFKVQLKEAPAKKMATQKKASKKNG